MIARIGGLRCSFIFGSVVSIEIREARVKVSQKKEVHRRRIHVIILMRHTGDIVE